MILLCVIRTFIVNMIYLLLSLLRALITLTGSFNWINNHPTTPPTSTHSHTYKYIYTHTHTRWLTQNHNSPTLLSSFSHQSTIFQAIYCVECLYTSGFRSHSTLRVNHLTLRSYSSSCCGCPAL